MKGHIVPVLKIDPQRLFLGYVKSPRKITKSVIISNTDKEKIEVVSFDSPEEIQVSYDEIDLSLWQKKLNIEFTFDKIKRTVWRFPIKVRVKCGQKIDLLTIPCVCVGSAKE